MIQVPDPNTSRKITSNSRNERVHLGPRNPSLGGFSPKALGGFSPKANFS